ncbi:MAG TPA: SDR family oxidoreductase [Verrucomicrobiales bacterium]|jgi:NAD(P)-dependent dehydrogenase (short-subunit alcohol dehydrogenase family)|nr:SDR family oxidoreductase [Verrucomicrobiales bacterium]
MPAYTDLRDQTVLVTGGANGIGDAIVRAFHAQDARVFFCDTDATAGQSLAKELGERVSFARVDLTSETQIARWVKQVTKNGPPVRVLVNNAARDPRMPLGSMSVKDWDDLFATNLRAFFLTARETAPHMADRTGSIINFSSITFHKGFTEMSAYVATKGGVIGFTRSLARELGPRGIRVNTVSPGWIMTQRQVKQFVTPAIKRLLHQSQCVPDLLQPADIADVVLFLASTASRAITGQEILADRGWAHS